MRTTMKERTVTPQQIKALQAQFHKMGFQMKTVTGLSASSQLAALTAPLDLQRKKPDCF